MSEGRMIITRKFVTSNDALYEPFCANNRLAELGRPRQLCAGDTLVCQYDGCLAVQHAA